VNRPGITANLQASVTRVLTLGALPAPRLWPRAFCRCALKMNEPAFAWRLQSGLVVVAAMVSMTSWWDISGRARQFMVMKLNSRCSTCST